ncbi:DUF6578 domain-containing protein [Allokutzneria albata]|uniref:Uncharacterized protein n=1 Tax=Allokutzneria albata TaxID=211114 RepID=A0A1H0C466_ALLAB|nr:DUF6578 domain-containing protein [Allokutzneria albata]SDN52642.1 hypothetical protein SAMN04489726_7014 [Allokutzneria albata]
MTIVPVLIEDWQYECCGDPFKIGDRVTWQLCYFNELGELLSPAERARLSLGVEAIPDSEDAHLSSGELHAFWRHPSTGDGLVEITGVLYEEHHDVHPVPKTTGTVKRIRRLAMRHRCEDGNVWYREPGTETFTELWESDLEPDAPAEAEQARWGIGMLVDLEVSLR